jgi:hypothetical protein
LKKIDELIDRIHALMQNHHSMTTQAVVVELTEMAAEADYITQQLDDAYDKLEDAEDLLRCATDLNEYKVAMKSLI